jgi:two-component sensor histidine kinase
MRDITERRQHQERAALMMREVNHRAKNLLAVVQAVALQTAGEDDPKLFAEHFSDRLAGLAASHDLLVRSEWMGVDLCDLVRSQLAHFADLIGTRITIDGPPVQLMPSAAQSIGMALHELATNAAKYGSLSVLEGQVRISWGIIADRTSMQFQIRWAEHGGPSVMLSTRRGFGHTVLVNMAEYTLDADVSVTSPPSGLVWQMTAPSEKVCAPIPPMTRQP